MTVTYANAVTNNTPPDATSTIPHAPNAANDPDAAAATAENKMSAIQLRDGQEYPVARGDIIKKGFDCKSAVEQYVAYLHGLSQIPGCPRYTGDRIKSCTWLQLLPIDNNEMLESEQFMVYFWWMHLKAKKAFYINFQKHASIVFVKQW